MEKKPAQFQVQFNIDKRHIGDVLEFVHQFKVDGLDMRPLVVRGAKGKAGGVPAWQVAADAVAKAGKPLRAKEVGAAIEAAGYKASGISTHLAKAIETKAIRKNADGLYVANKRSA